MGKLALLAALSALAICANSAEAQAPGVATPAPATPQSQSILTLPDSAVTYASWDNTYLYVAAVVNKPTLHGDNTSAFSDPLKDDSVVFTLQTSAANRPDKPNADTVAIAASAMGGVQLYKGDHLTPLFNGMSAFNQAMADVLKIEDAKKREQARLALFSKIIKFQVVRHGEEKTTHAFMPGYTVEIAIPWVDIGIDPKPGLRLGYNVSVLSRSADSPAVMSWSSKVLDQSEVFDPADFGTLILDTSAHRPTADMAVATEAVKFAPVIDGIIEPGEWSELASIPIIVRPDAAAQLSLIRTQNARSRQPFTAKPALPDVASVVRMLPNLSRHSAQPVPHVTLALFNMSYQADAHKSLPTSGVDDHGGSLLAHHPITGTGPWFSYANLDWVTAQLTEAHQEGIDVLLPDYALGRAEPHVYAISALAMALKRLHANSLESPSIGLFLDMRDISPSESIGLNELYHIIHDYYASLPPWSRFEIPLSSANGGGMACPVFLANSKALQGLPNGWQVTLREWFARDFHHTDLILIGTDDFVGDNALDGDFNPSIIPGTVAHTAGTWIHVPSVYAGYDPTLTGDGSVTPLVRREQGAYYQHSWTEVLSHSPQWVLIPGWNEFQTGSEAAPSLEEGYSVSDLTREFSRQLQGVSQQGAVIQFEDAPRSMVAGEICKVNIRAENTGVAPWGAQPPAVAAAWAYRWIRNGGQDQFGAPTPVDGIVLPMHTATVTIPIAAIGSDGNPLPAGQYQLQVGLATLQSTGAGAVFMDGNHGGSTVTIPVTISSPVTSSSVHVRLVNDSLPATVETGSVYPVSVRLRNDGKSAWSPGERISLVVDRSSRSTADDATTDSVDAADASVTLKQGVAPGQTVDATVNLPVMKGDGTPLTVWKDADPWKYTAHWDVVDPDGHGASTGYEPLTVITDDFGPRFTVNRTPAELPGGKRLPVLLSLRNDGPQTWLKGAVSVGYHWYYLDGTEYAFNDEITPIASNVAPGSSINGMLTWLNTPQNNGYYWLVWDLKVGDRWSTATRALRPNEQTVQLVRIVQGQLHFVDLADAAAPVIKRKGKKGTSPRGFDGNGDDFPDSELPPYALANIVPDGIWLPGAVKGPSSARSISFKWPSTAAGTSGFITCSGQELRIGDKPQSCSTVHVLLAATGGEVDTQIKLIFKEPVGTAEDLFALTAYPWLQPEENIEHVAYLCRYHLTPAGPHSGTCALYDAVIQLPTQKSLVAIRLPNEPSVKVAAITLVR